MYSSPFDAEKHIDELLTGRKAAGQRIAARKTIDQLDAENVRIRVEQLNTRMFNTAALWLPDYFDNLRPPYPLLPAKCPVHIIATPAKGSPLKKKDIGWHDMLVTGPLGSITVSDTELAEAITLVAPKRYAIIEGYQGAREIINTRVANDTTYHSFKMLAGSTALTWFPAAKCTELRRAS